MNDPATRLSLIINIRDPQHHEAWEEFVEIYEPLVYRLARSKGFQHADANDLCQDVLSTVGRSIQRFDPDPAKGHFRGWLFRITRNLMINVLTRSKEVRGAGDSAIAELLDQHIDPACKEATRFDIEYERAAFHWASERVRESVGESTWMAFWLTSVQGHSVQDVARRLEKKPGTVRVARCRILAKIKREVERLETKIDQ